MQTFLEKKSNKLVKYLEKKNKRLNLERDFSKLRNSKTDLNKINEIIEQIFEITFLISFISFQNIFWTSKLV